LTDHNNDALGRRNLRRHRGTSTSSSSSDSFAEARNLLENLAALLPRRPADACPVGFLLAMLRAAALLGASAGCRADLERRVGWQLERATVDDLLIPLYDDGDDRLGATGGSSTLFDLDAVARIVRGFLDHERSMRSAATDRGPADDHDRGSLLVPTDRYTGSGGDPYDDDFRFRRQRGSDQGFCGGASSPPALTPASRIMRVARLIDCFLAEVAPDPNLTAAKFAAFAELMPEYARVVDDGLYRAIDVYLKVCFRVF
jgi:hypothetical protein